MSIKKVFFTLLCFIFSTLLSAYDNYVEVTNSTGFDIYYLFVSHEDSDSWEDDVLEDDVILDGDTYTVYVSGYTSTIFDIRLEDEDGDTYTIWDVDIEIDDLVITLDHLDLDDDGYVEVTNNTGYDGYFLYVSHEDSDSWEEDVLGDDVLYDGETYIITVEGYDSSIFDIRLEDEEGDTYTIWDVDIEYEDLEITLDDLD